MSPLLPLRTFSDALAAVSAIQSAGKALSLPEHLLLEAVAVGFRAAAGGLGSDCALRIQTNAESKFEMYRVIGDAEELVFAAPTSAPMAASATVELDGAATLEGLAQLLASASTATQALAKSRSAMTALESELDETNRGVMALYAELDERADKLRRADELKSQFLSYASHELRTPLNGIVGLVRLLRSASVTRPAEDMKQLGFIQQAAEEMREMVNDLLDLAKVEAGKVEIQRAEFDLTFVFGALRGIFRPLLQSDVVLIFEDTSAVPSIYSDEGKVSQILRNLLSNALKFTEHGSVRVSAIAGHDTVRISVSDTGIGIPEEELGRIFEEFTQVRSSLQRRVRGTGLGLPLCRKLAALLGGSLTVESTFGKGSIFTLTLPLAVDGASTKSLGETTRKPARSRSTILIIDDVEIDRYLLSSLITAGGDYDIIQAEDGKSGIDAARREHPDLIFLDLNLPRMDGFAIAAELGASPETRHIPIVAVTAENLTEAAEARIRSMAQGIILKDQLSDAHRVIVNLQGSPQVTLD